MSQSNLTDSWRKEHNKENESNDHQQNSNNTTHPFVLKIRFSHSGETHHVQLPRGSSTTIQELTKLIIDHCIKQHESLRNEYSKKPSIRLIHNGRLLTGSRQQHHHHHHGLISSNHNELLPISLFHLEPDSYVHCSFSDLLPLPNTSTNTNNSNVNSTQNNAPAGAFYQGFDVLMNTGLSSEEINAVRRQFYSSRSHLLEMHQRGELSQSDLYNIESIWMNESPGSSTSSTLSSLANTTTQLTPQQQEQQQRLQEQQRNDRVGNVYAFFLGLLLGFFFGIITIVALLEKKALSKRLAIGIQIGVATNIIVSIFKYYYPSVLPYLL